MTKRMCFRTSAVRGAGRIGAGLLTLLAVARAPLPAQGAPDAQARGGFTGRVTDGEGQPVAGAEIRVGGVTTLGRSGADGWFRVPAVPAGLLWFGVRKLGYRPVADLIRLAPGDTVDVVIERIGPELDTVRVQARADAAWERDMRRFAQALEAARFGNVITADEIARRQPIVTSDLFQTMAGFRVIGAGGGAAVVGRGDCRPFLVVDGFPDSASRVNDILPQSIRLLITYRNFGQLPALFHGPTANRDCGAIVIYTM
jgi:hypothetical protein